MYPLLAIILALPFTISTALAVTTGPGPTNGIEFVSPIGDATVTDVLERLIEYAVLIVSPLAAIMILWGAFQILTSSGKEEKYKAGRKTIIYALGGFVIVILASGLVDIFQELIEGLNP